MARGLIDTEGLNEPDVVALRNTPTPDGLPNARSASALRCC